MPVQQRRTCVAISLIFHDHKQGHKSPCGIVAQQMPSQIDLWLWEQENCELWSTGDGPRLLHLGHGNFTSRCGLDAERFRVAGERSVFSWCGVGESRWLLKPSLIRASQAEDSPIMDDRVRIDIITFSASSQILMRVSGSCGQVGLALTRLGLKLRIVTIAFCQKTCLKKDFSSAASCMDWQFPICLWWSVLAELCSVVILTKEGWLLCS